MLNLFRSNILKVNKKLISKLYLYIFIIILKKQSKNTLIPKNVKLMSTLNDRSLYSLSDEEQQMKETGN
jgi:hypothetical protein